MKKIAAVMAAVMTVGAISVYGIIEGSKHDFQNASWNTTDKDICGPCHIPHNAQNDLAPLWDHSNAVDTAFTMYSSKTFQATKPTKPDGESLACLSCHDGVTGVDAFGGKAKTTNILSTSSAYIGTDLSDDHPISFVYATSISGGDSNLHQSAAVTNLLGKDLKVQCSSCHDVHNTAGITNMLRMSNQGSDLCLVCHNK